MASKNCPRRAATGRHPTADAEELGFEQVGRDRGAVDRDEGTLAAGGREVEDLRHELLAGSGLAADQYRQITLDKALEDAVELFHGRRDAADVALGEAQLRPFLLSGEARLEAWDRHQLADQVDERREQGPGLVTAAEVSEDDESREAATRGREESGRLGPGDQETIAGRGSVLGVPEGQLVEPFTKRLRIRVAGACDYRLVASRVVEGQQTGSRPAELTREPCERQSATARRRGEIGHEGADEAQPTVRLVAARTMDRLRGPVVERRGRVRRRDRQRQLDVLGRQALEPQLHRAEGHHVADVDLGASDRAAVDEGAVLAPVVDHHHAVRADLEQGVVTGDALSRQHQPIRRRAADRNRAGLEGVSEIGSAEAEASRQGLVNRKGHRNPPNSNVSR